MQFHTAITRKPGEDFSAGITTSDLGPPEYQLMLSQHTAYVSALESLGLQVIILDPLPGYPDAYFVEDAAIFTPEVAILTRPGAASRRGEAGAIQNEVTSHRTTYQIEAPGTLDGGDVLIVGRQVFVGLSARTNPSGAEQLSQLLEPFDYQTTLVQVGSGLHLKSGVNWIGEDRLLVTPDFEEHPAFQPFQKIVVDPTEAYAANTLWINDHLITPAGFPHTRLQLDDLGLPITELNVSEARKMDGGLTCMSLRF